MSDMKHDAIVSSGIPIYKRYEIPEELIPPDSRVEIDAKIAAGYYSTTQVTDLSKTAGRLWEDTIRESRSLEAYLESVLTQIFSDAD